ncbi:excinuclease ABC subunit UvrA [Candidatus Caldatribacterium sp.]|uniref:excinuclease ABC subunit UvrA n=1 Tax=Candidatus Caldatribacterium sp. TaxID=2282143 RepID=UPI00299AAA51|nr:excinuclease ABC subunit UvrA [Candidatus Caldatribacterium sp.]MDW8080881.1 excinuclease ABC subunit UvrA [Candidatus Calescibacterium sp.]
MKDGAIIIRGAREHNLKNIDLEIPRNRLVVITGLSGSGKSSLAFDTIYAEGQRRYLESLSSYARQFLERMEKPDVDSIEGLSPAIAINQKASSHNPRSTVGTVTEIYDYMRVLFARCGKVFCPQCGKPIARQTVQQITDEILALPQGSRVLIMAPLVRGRKGEYRKLLSELFKNGFARVCINGEIVDLEEWEAIELDRNKKHDIDLVVDRIIVEADIDRRVSDSVEIALRYGKGVLKIGIWEDGEIKERLFSERFACVDCGVNFPEITPRMFSFNNPYGACPRCSGLGFLTFVDPDLVVPDYSKSIDEGAIVPWDNLDPESYWGERIRRILAARGIPLQRPFGELTDEERHFVLYGGDGFEGVIPLLERKLENAREWWEQEEIAPFLSMKVCPECHGDRLRRESLSVKIQGFSIGDLSRLTVGELLEFFENLRFLGNEAVIAEPILREIRSRLGFLKEVGLEYLTLARSAATLSGGEAQRIRLATQIGSGLVGVLYVLDEPTIGLHPRDNQKLIAILKKLRDLGNTVIVVEHDAETIRSADFVVDIGPGAGDQGGRIVATGSPQEIMEHPESLTGMYLSGRKRIPVPSKRKSPQGAWLVVRGARANNLKNITVRIPLGLLVGITGVSGSGKSTLLYDVLYRGLSRMLHGSKENVGDHDAIEGVEYIDKVIVIDQSSIGRTPRSNPATYTGVFTDIRALFASLPESKARGYKPGRFSFNLKGGRCEACQGNGVIKIEMHFLPDVFVTCEQCQGKRYGRETLDIKYKGKSIADVLDMSVDEAITFFGNIPFIRRKLEMLQRVGLGYIKLGQPATTLSGGEAQRIKLARELGKVATGRTLYLLDEPTTGLHFADVEKLLSVLLELRDRGNTVLIIEHNLDVIKTCDYLIDLGPEGGDRGGYIVAQGTPEEVAQVSSSYTGQFLREVLFAERKGELCSV